MKKIIAIVLAFSALAFVSAQGTVGEPDAASIGIDTAQQKLQVVTVDKFESAGFWNVYIMPDEGVANGRLFTGGPAAKADEPKPEERYVGIDPKIADVQTYGARVDFFKRGFNTVYVLAQKPIP
ncbi:MAG TPA: flagellar filament protein FlaA, partial [Spirochaetia bacterium]|nr:flagellar filament protein FlaA [Spirochaetia bacterium]